MPTSDGLPEPPLSSRRTPSNKRKAEPESADINHVDLRLIVEASPSAIVVVNEEGLITLFSTQSERLFGYSSDEVLSQSVEILLPERYRGTHLKHRASFLASPSPRAMGAGRDLFGRRKDGSEVPIEIGLNPIQTDGGTFVLASIIDITERKRSEQIFRQVIEHAPYGKLLVDKTGSITLVNALVEKFFGYHRDELLGQSIEMLVPQRFRDHHAALRDGFVEKPTARSMGSGRDLFGLRKDGSEFPVEIGLNPLETEQGMMVLATIVDITERKRTEAARLASEGRLDFALQTSQIGAWELSLIDGSANRTLIHDQIFGYAELLPEWTYEIFLEHVLPEDRVEVDRSFRAATETVSNWSFECRIRRVDAEVRWIWAAGGHERNSERKPVRMSGIVQDITERKLAEDEIRRLNEDLEQRVTERTAQLSAVNKELESFSYSVSHDLRAPLRHINGFSQALLEDYSDKIDEEGQGYLREVRGASRQMAELIDDLLQLARVTRSEMRSEAVDLSALAESIVSELRTQKGERNVAVRIEPALLAQGDKRLLHVLLTNLLGNAWKFTSKNEDSEIVFGCRQLGRERAFFVHDNGAGFDMAFANKLFGAFQRLHTNSEFEGTGIGLATAQRVVNRHGGRVWAEGRVNEGATFFFTLANFREAGNGEQSDLTS